MRLEQVCRGKEKEIYVGSSKVKGWILFRTNCTGMCAFSVTSFVPDSLQAHGL